MLSFSKYWVFTLALPALAAEDRVIFNRDVRPIMAEYCYHCHGPDPGSRKEGIRFDREDGFFGDRDGAGPTVLKGNAEKSPLFTRITTKDEDEVMPPPKEHKTLKPTEVAVIKKWIEQGAEWQPHWAFIAPSSPAVPSLAKHPVDAFIREKLAATGLKPSPSADKRTLARRVSLDLTGLPPSPEIVESFVNDAAADAYEKLVDKLLASPAYGEHRARYWLDAARYGDTHGLHIDNYREMWPYRDWVIAAFNRNQRFDEFTVEQIAGDLLPNATTEQRIATGFHRCNVTTAEGGTIPEENLANYAKDRVETTSWVWLGLTSNCAVCHDHKFDPITQKDFYAMSAFFRNTTQDHSDRNVRDTAPVLVIPTGADAKRMEAIPAEIVAASAGLAERQKTLGADFEKWQATAKAASVEAVTQTKTLIAHLPLNDNAPTVKAMIAGKPATFTLPPNVVWKPDGKSGPAPQVADGASIDLGGIGDFEKSDAFSASVWFFRPAATTGSGSILSRMDKGGGFRGWDIYYVGNEITVHIVSTWPNDALKVSTTDEAGKPDIWRHVTASYDGSGKAAGVKIYVSGKQRKTKVDTDKLKGSIRTKVPFFIGRRANGPGETFTGAVQDVRIYSGALSAKQALAIYELPDLRIILDKPVAARSPEEKQRLLAFYSTGDPRSNELTAKVAALESEKAEIQKRSPVTHIQMEKAGSQPMARLLNRGQYDQPKDELKPAVIAALHPMPAGAPGNRLGLAQWLVAKDNPLTSRVTVNRFWQEIFGTGIVKTSEDFGIMSEAPSHPALLDWLAVDFAQNGWDVKRLMRLLVTSETYKQSAGFSKDDPENRLLARAPRYRMDAEVLRDYALAASGIMSAKLGGPSVRPYQPDGVWEAVAMPNSDTGKYKRDTGEALYRRSLYTFWKRSAPPASLELFGAPSRETCTIRRERTNTPLQALVTMNDPQFVEAARHLAQAALTAGKLDPLDFMARRVLCRPLRPTEVPILTASKAALLTYYTQTPADAAALISFGESKADPAIPPAQLAAWTMVATQLLNLDEALNK